MLEETEIGEMMRGCRGGGVALGAWMCVQLFLTNHLRSILTLRDASVATVTEICTDAETIL